MSNLSLRGYQLNQPVIKDRYSRRVNSLFGNAVIQNLPLIEPSGSVARDISGRGNNGAYSNVTLANTPSPVGGLAPLFNGTTSVIDIYSAGLNTKFTPAALTLSIWAKVSAAGVWTDSAVRYLMSISADSNNIVRIYKAGANNTLYMDYKAGGTTKTGGGGSHSPTGWTHYGLTVDVAGDKAISYLNGVQWGATLTGLGTWAGALGSTVCVVGAAANNANSPYSGWLSHPLVLNRAATAAEMLKLAQWGGL